MTTAVNKNNRIWVGQYDLSGALSKSDMPIEWEALDDTTYGSLGHRSRAAGLPDVDFSFEGLVELGVGFTDAIMFSKIETPAETPLTSVPQPSGGLALAEPSAEGDIAYFFNSMSFKYQPGAPVGTILRFSGDAKGVGDEPVRGRVLVPKPAAARTTSGTSSSQQLGAVAADEFLCAALHVFSGSGGNLDVDVRSDDNGGMSSPTTRISFTTATGPGAQYATPLAGAIADDYFDVDYTISAGSFDFAVIVGIA